MRSQLLRLRGSTIGISSHQQKPGSMAAVPTTQPLSCVASQKCRFATPPRSPGLQPPTPVIFLGFFPDKRPTKTRKVRKRDGSCRPPGFLSPRYLAPVDMADTELAAYPGCIN